MDVLRLQINLAGMIWWTIQESLVKTHTYRSIWYLLPRPLIHYLQLIMSKLNHMKYM